MNPFTFEFAGKNSRDAMGIYATSYDILIPQKRQNRQVITFRHGSQGSGATYFNDRILTLRCFWFNDFFKTFTRAALREVSYWLSQRSVIRLDCEPDKYYYGEIMDTPSIEARYRRILDDIKATHGTFDISFNCDPFAYGDQVTKSLVAGINAIIYKGTAESPTLITIRNPNAFAVTGVNITVTDMRR